MKTIVLCLTLLATGLTALAFDPIGPPPQKTVRWTHSFACAMVVPRVEFTGDTSLAEGIDFLQLRHVIPADYGIRIDAVALGAERLKEPLFFQAKDLKLIDVLSRIADQIDADLLISAGTIRFLPRTGS